MFTDYQKQVLLAYHEKRAADALSLNLTHSTPAKLRAECAVVFSVRYRHKQDEKALSAFFGPRDNAAGYIQAIRKFETDKFRPLDKFLKGNIIGTDEKNIELLAWLIDFESRPYQWETDYAAISREWGKSRADEGNVNMDRPEAEKKGAAGGTGKDSSNNTSGETVALLHEGISGDTSSVLEKLGGKAVRTPKYRNTILSLFMLVIAGGGIYFLGNRRSLLSGNEKCMYWTGDHYQLVSCDKKLGDVPVYGLDSLKTQGFKKITRPDTLTQRSIGHVWYSKINGEVEFFTAAGFHPVHTERRLKPMTELILTKYATGGSALRAKNN